MSVSIVNAKGTTIALSSQYVTKNPLAESRLDLPEVVIDDISSALDLDVITKPIMDVLYQCYGIARCEYFGKDGKWIEPR